MTSFLIDPSGSPVFDSQGVYTTVDGATEFKQRMYNIFNTIYGTEPFYPNYGFDIISVIQVPPAGREMALQMAVVKALNVYNVQDLYGINTINTSITGATGIIGFTVTDTSGRTYGENLSVQTGE